MLAYRNAGGHRAASVAAQIVPPLALDVSVVASSETHVDVPGPEL